MGLLSRLLRTAVKEPKVQPLGFDDWRRAFGSSVEMTPQAQAVRMDEMYPVHAYRGMNMPHSDAHAKSAAQWFTSKPEVAETYMRYGKGNMLAARLNPGKTLEIDAGGATYDQVPVDALPKELRKHFYIDPATGRIARRTMTDRIAAVAEKNGYDSVVFKNIRDTLSANDAYTPVSDVYAVFPRAAHNVRAAWAQADPARADVVDLLGGFGGVALGGGLLSRAMSEQQSA